MTRKKDAKVQVLRLTKKALPQDVITNLRKFRKEQRSKGKGEQRGQSSQLSIDGIS
jgi:hypothetical protein